MAANVATGNDSAVIAIWSSVGRDSLESLCIEEAPMSLFAPGFRFDHRIVLGSVAYPVVAVDAELSDNYIIADHLYQSCFLVCHLGILVWPERAKPASCDPPPCNISSSASSGIRCDFVWQHSYNSNRGSIVCVLGCDSRKTAKLRLSESRTILIAVGSKRYMGRTEFLT
jgi:hypothetical protein